MNQPGKGWDSSSEVWTWEELARLEGWQVGRAHEDEHGQGFWLHATRQRGAVTGRPVRSSC